MIYVAICVPMVLMLIAGALICVLKKDTTISNHHFAGNFNIGSYNKKIMTLFSLTGILFLIGGIIIIKEQILAGIAVIIVALIIFIIRFIRIQKRY